MKYLILFVLLIALYGKAFSCTIIYSYDNAGNRIKRAWSCDTSGSNTNPTYRMANNSPSPEDSGNIENTCSLYPNPSNGYFKMRMEYAVNADIYVMDVKGSVVLKKRLEGKETDLDIRQYAAGVYTLHLVSPGYEFSVKIVKE
jgi:hypothetical protein